VITKGRIIRREEFESGDVTVEVRTCDLILDQTNVQPEALQRGRLVTAAIASAHIKATRIVDQAHAAARALLLAAVEEATLLNAQTAVETREHALASLAAAHLQLRHRQELSATRNVDRTIAVAVMLAERLLGTHVSHDPAATKALALRAITETRGAVDLAIEVHPDDAAAVQELLGELSMVAKLEPNAELTRGSLVISTDLGKVDGRLHTQLARLGAALRGPLLTQTQTRPEEMAAAEGALAPHSDSGSDRPHRV
jgi:flagellar biosynthesis/type III secretory pathway protein FliH